MSDGDDDDDTDADDDWFSATNRPCICVCGWLEAWNVGWLRRNMCACGGWVCVWCAVTVQMTLVGIVREPTAMYTPDITRRR